MLGRFLEIGVHATDILESLAFYESLGFVQARVGDAHAHPYAVVTDGRLYLGLHATERDSPSLAWIHPGLAAHAVALQSLGIELAYSRLGEEAFHELAFHDPSGQQIVLVEARTYSPPAAGATRPSALGYFEEFGIPASDLARATAFWDALGLVAFDPVRAPFTRVVASHRDLNIGLYDVDLRRPVLTFSEPDMAARIANLREQGHRFVERLPRGMDATANALLEAPEGTWLLLTTGFE
jgi:catechol 2,3-dioxygenase-like lactoylglutathione lyase family enzyme